PSEFTSGPPWKAGPTAASCWMPAPDTSATKPWLIDPPVRVGERLFAVSALGTAGGSISQGFVADVSGAGIQHDAAVGPAFQGGPLVNSEGEVVAVATRAYSPLGFASDGVYFAPLISAACEKVLRCPSPDEVAGPGARR
ncbi:MAG TPA: trypsin-like peptidase domain-containing protein, partial [Acidimicrobiales bacterium]|nr:trypsin-like peptidase domain-containing protein [Acidimicrobiales bacterium]